MGNIFKKDYFKNNLHKFQKFIIYRAISPIQFYLWNWLKQRKIIISVVWRFSWWPSCSTTMRTTWLRGSSSSCSTRWPVMSRAIRRSKSAVSGQLRFNLKYICKECAYANIWLPLKITLSISWNIIKRFLYQNKLDLRIKKIQISFGMIISFQMILDQIRRKLTSNICDDVMEVGWSFLWNITGKDLRNIFSITSFRATREP